MRTFFNDVFTQLKGIWARLDGGQRLVVVVVLAATVTGLGAIVWYAGRPSYEAIFTATSADELKQIRQALGSESIPYVVDESGSTILVERARIGQANMAINGAGLRTASDGATGTSIIEDAETKQFKLDGAARVQAAAAISALEGVVGVTVTASRPRRSPFRDREEETRPRATIALRLKSGVPFEAVARSAASLCSSQLAVPLENVDVVNAATQKRWRHDPEREAGGGSSEFLTAQRAIGDERTRQAQEALDLLWPGKTVVTVGAELDSAWETLSQKVLPPEPILRSEKSTKDTSDSTPAGGGDAAGAAGARSNTSKTTQDREFVTEIGERRVGKLAPDIRRLSVALLYDKSLEQAEGFDKEVLVKTVKAIVGWDPRRDSDDSFSTLAGEFAPFDIEAAASAGPGMADLALQWGPTVGQILGVLVVVMFLKGLFKRARPVAAKVEAPPGDAEEQLTPDEQQKRMRREIERSIAGDPAALAKLLESWLTEQKA